MEDTKKNNSENSQNIDDIVKLLKISYEEDSSSTPKKENISSGADKEMSNDDIQAELRKKFNIMSVIDSAVENEEDDYALDSDFLREVNTHDKKSRKKIEIIPEKQAEQEEQEAPKEAEEAEEQENPENLEEAEATVEVPAVSVEPENAEDEVV